MNSLERGSQAAISGGGNQEASLTTWTWRMHRAQRAAFQAVRAQWATDPDTHKVQAENNGKQTGGKPPVHLNASRIAWPYKEGMG